MARGLLAAVVESVLLDNTVTKTLYGLLKGRRMQNKDTSNTIYSEPATNKEEICEKKKQSNVLTLCLHGDLINSVL